MTEIVTDLIGQRVSYLPERGPQAFGLVRAAYCAPAPGRGLLLVVETEERKLTTIAAGAVRVER